eukprot:844666-Prymnesium_polylepis.1
MTAGARALRMPVPRVHDIPATLHVGASVRAPVSHSPATAPSYRGVTTITEKQWLCPGKLCGDLNNSGRSPPDTLLTRVTPR